MYGLNDGQRAAEADAEAIVIGTKRPDKMATYRIPETAILATKKCYLRPYEASDAEALAKAANDPEIAKNMRSGFPSPYTLANAQFWIELCRAEPISLTFAIFTPEGEYAGAVSLMEPKGDKIYAGTREIGYFAAQRFWGRGSKLSPLYLFTYTQVYAYMCVYIYLVPLLDFRLYVILFLVCLGKGSGGGRIQQQRMSCTDGY